MFVENGCRESLSDKQMYRLRSVRHFVFIVPRTDVVESRSIKLCFHAISS